MSLKAYAPTLNITLIHDDCIKKFTEIELSFFDVLKQVNPSDYLINGKPQYQRLKLCVDMYTDYEKTLYIDVDTMWFPEKSIESLLDALDVRNFHIGYNGSYNPVTKRKSNLNYTFWGVPERISEYFKLKNELPQTISGVFYFDSSMKEMFKIAREVYDDQKAPHIRWANGKPDEYCFNVALSKIGYTQDDAHFVYFDKINGDLPNDRIYSHFWGIAAGGNRLKPQIKKMYNDLVDLYADFYGQKKYYHIDKKNVIPERVSNV